MYQRSMSSPKLFKHNAFNILNLNSNKLIKSRKIINDNNISEEIDKINSPKNYNISMLSKQKQLQLNKNKILLINLTSSMSELARLLIIGGFNIYLYDKEIINENDINNNIFLKRSDLGKNRLETIYNYLVPLSPTVNITTINDYTTIKDYKIAIVGFSNFNSLIEFEEYFNRKDILFFCLNSSGLYAFCYHNLNNKNCKKFISKEKEKEKYKLSKFKKKKEKEKNNDEILFTKNNMVQPSNFLKKSEKFFEIGKKYEKDYLIFAIFLLEIYYKKNVDKKDIDNVLKNEMIGDNNFVKKMFFIENFLIKKQCFEVIINQQLMETIKKFVLNFNREFSPICCIIAKKLFGILFNFFKSNIIPKKTFITYNSDITEYDEETFLQ